MQKESMKPLLKNHFHYQITPEIRRELFSSVNRGQKTPEMITESFSHVCSNKNGIGQKLKKEKGFEDLLSSCCFSLFYRENKREGILL